MSKEDHRFWKCQRRLFSHRAGAFSATDSGAEAPERSPLCERLVECSADALLPTFPALASDLGKEFLPFYKVTALSASRAKWAIPYSEPC